MSDSAETAEGQESGGKTRRRTHGLGRGLSSLLGEMTREESIAEPNRTTAAGGDDLRSIEIARIRPHPDQPRRHFDAEALDELAASIRERGVIQPIIVRPHADGYQIVAGERRWRAAQRAQLHRIPAIIRDLSDTQLMEVALVENIQRRDLNPIEEAEAYARLIGEYGHSQEALAKIVGKSRSHLANLIRLLDLPQPVRQAVIEARLSMGHARTLVGLDNAVELAEQIERKALSVRQAERLAASAKNSGSEKPARGKKSAQPGMDIADADIRALEQHIADQLGVKVSIDHRKDGSGQVVLRYTTLEQVDMICQRLSGERI